MDRKYIYSGPPSGVTLNLGEKKREVLFRAGREVSLPEEHPYVKRLVAQRRLRPVLTAPSAPAPPAPTGGGKRSTQPSEPQKPDTDKKETV